MSTPKEAVAYHEAGHALAVLQTPIAEFLLSAEIFLDDGEWLGKIQMDGMRDRSTSDPNKVFEVTKNLGGPLCQHVFAPETFPPKLVDSIDSEGGVLKGLRKLRIDGSSLELHWTNDVASFLYTCPNLPEDWFEPWYTIEDRLVEFFRSEEGGRMTRRIKDQLFTKLYLSSIDLFAIAAPQSVDLRLPENLNCTH